MYYCSASRLLLHRTIAIVGLSISLLNAWRVGRVCMASCRCKWDVVVDVLKSATGLKSGALKELQRAGIANTAAAAAAAKAAAAARAERDKADAAATGAAAEATGSGAPAAGGKGSTRAWLKSKLMGIGKKKGAAAAAGGATESGVSASAGSETTAATGARFADIVADHDRCGPAGASAGQHDAYRTYR